MLVPGVPLGPEQAEVVFDPDRWLASCSLARTAYRGLAASTLIACCHVRSSAMEGLPGTAWDEKHRILAVTTAIRPERQIPLLPLPQWALGLMREHADPPDAATLFATANGRPMPHGNLIGQLITFGRRNGIAENLPSNLAATFRDCIGEGPIAAALLGLACKAGTIELEEQRRHLQRVHPLAEFRAKTTAPRPNANERLIARAAACTHRRTLDKGQREAARLAEFPVLYEGWKTRKLSAKQFAMHLGLDNVHRWIRRYRKDGVEGLKHAPTPVRYRDQILAMRIARGEKESVALFHGHLREQGIHVSEPWLARTLENSPVPHKRIVDAKWRRTVVEIFIANEPVRNATAFWRLLRDKHGYPYTRFTAIKSIEDAGHQFTSRRMSKGRADLVKREKVARLYRLHFPIGQDKFLAFLRRVHDISMTGATLCDVLDEVGVHRRKHVSAELRRKIVELYRGRATERTTLTAFWRLLRDEHGFTHTFTCLRLMLIRLGLYVPRPMTEGERRRWARYRSTKAAAGISTAAA